MASTQVRPDMQRSRQSSQIEIKGGSGCTEAQNSFSADSPYYESYVENELRNMAILHDTLHDIASRTKTFGKCGNLMSEATRRLALSCRLRRPYTAEDEKDIAIQERRMKQDVAERRSALGDEMVSLLGVMSDVSDMCNAITFSYEQYSYSSLPLSWSLVGRCWKRLLMLKHKWFNPSKQRWLPL